MDYLSINDVLYEYFLRDDEGNVSGINRALDEINLQVRQGDFITILGRNGSGKSTLAKLINALLIPAGGSVIVDNMDTKDPENTLPIRMKTGMVFQNPDNQIVAGVVEEDVAFGPENIGMPSEDIRVRVQEVLTRLKMWDKRRKSPNHLSGGQKQRVAIAGVLAMEPKCIILDEATSMLDPGGRADVIRIVHELNKEMGITIILITHNMEEAIGSDYIYVMDTGKVVMEGVPQEIFSKEERLLERGLSVPSAVKLANILRSRGLPLPGNILTMAMLRDAIIGLS